jgi:hypothetical protein
MNTSILNIRLAFDNFQIILKLLIPCFFPCLGQTFTETNPEDGKSSFPKYRFLIKIMENINVFLTFWLSKVILKISNNNIKLKFREIEKRSIKLLEVKCHRIFNETCINNNLLPTYTNIYIHTWCFKNTGTNFNSR